MLHLIEAITVLCEQITCNTRLRVALRVFANKFIGRRNIFILQIVVVLGDMHTRHSFIQQGLSAGWLESWAIRWIHTIRVLLYLRSGGG